MNIFKYLQVISIALICASSFAKIESAVDKGEWDFGVYDGPLDPRLKINYQVQSQEFLDEVSGREYFDEMLAPQITTLSQDFTNFIYPNFTCSKHELSDNLDYMKYLIRLTSIASLYEFYRQSSIGLYQYGDETSCKLDYDVLFKKCSPKSQDMKLFIKRVSDHFPDIVDWGKYPIKLETDRNFRLENYHPALAKLLSKYFLGTSKKSLVSACNYARNEIQNLCSEEDSYMAASSIAEIKQEILSASAFKIINETGKGEACFDRYADMTKSLEKIDHKSQSIIKSALKGEEELKVFWFGSLREFDDKGITLVEEKVAEAPVEKKAEPKKVEPVKTVDIKSIKIIRKPKPEPVKPQPVKTEVKVSTFEKAVYDFFKTKKQTDLDMAGFKTDYKFSKKTLERFNGNLRSYQTRKQLAKMKRVDDVGSSEAPMSLTFIKYLIDYNLHQGLYNMTGILGNEFYVINDLEGKSTPVKIILNNNEETKFKWQIWVTGL